MKYLHFQDVGTPMEPNAGLFIEHDMSHVLSSKPRRIFASITMVIRTRTRWYRWTYYGRRWWRENAAWYGYQNRFEKVRGLVINGKAES